MKMSKNGNFGALEALKVETMSVGIELNEEKLIKFKNYMDLLIKWNENINLTAITDEYEIIMKHFIDCIEITKYIEKGANIIDVGTGAGFPGIVIAIMMDDKVKITLLDALNKRLLFLQEVVEKLNLKNVTIIHGRAEEMANKEEYREKYDIAVSRAVANLGVLLEYDSPFVKVNGKCLLMKGNNMSEEILNAKNALDILNCKLSKKYNYKYKVYDEEYSRYILEILKVKSTPSKYPRNYGKIKKSPL